MGSDSAFGYYARTCHDNGKICTRPNGWNPLLSSCLLRIVVLDANFLEAQREGSRSLIVHEEMIKKFISSSIHPGNTSHICLCCRYLDHVSCTAYHNPRLRSTHWRTRLIIAHIHCLELRIGTGYCLAHFGL